MRKITSVVCMIVFCEGLFAETIGVMVDSVDVGTGSGLGWSYEGGRLLIAEKGVYQLTGSGTVGVDVKSDATVVVSNLSVTVSTGAALSVADGKTLQLLVVGNNTFKTTATTGFAGISVPGGETAATLVISNVQGVAVGDAKLTAIGGTNGAGIGGDVGMACGHVFLAGCTVSATGGGNAAGIGGGGNSKTSLGDGGNVTILGGSITAKGGQNGAGIGGGRFGAGGTVRIEGSILTAKGGTSAAGIGGGSAGAGGTTIVTGGTISVSAGTSGSYDIGSGVGAEVSGETKILGGSVGTDTSLIVNPTDGESPLRCVPITVANSPKMAVSSLDGLGGYGIADVQTSSMNKLFFWLTEGMHSPIVINSNKIFLAEVTSDSSVVDTGVLITFGGTENYSVWWKFNEDKDPCLIDSTRLAVRSGSENIKLIFIADRGYEVKKDSLTIPGPITRAYTVPVEDMPIAKERAGLILIIK